MFVVMIGVWLLIAMLGMWFIACVLKLCDCESAADGFLFVGAAIGAVGVMLCAIGGAVELSSWVTSRYA